MSKPTITAMTAPPTGSPKIDAGAVNPGEVTAISPGGPASRRLSHPKAFVAITAIFITFMAASSAPSPLYVVYHQQWGFSATTLTVVFAVYVLGLIGSLLVLGALSDYVGRRPVLAAAIALELAALVLFITAGNVTVLLLARLAQGIATGAAMTTLGAALVDLNPPHAPGRAGVVSGVAPLGGLAVGALGCGALVQFGPQPTHLVYILLLGGMVVAAFFVAVMPETAVRRPGGLASLKPKVGIPARLRPDVLALTPMLVASWALGGLYLSLGPSVAASLFGLTNHLVGGLVVTLLCATGAITAFSLWLASVVFKGIQFDTKTALIVSALLLGFANAVVKPLLIVLTLPLTLVTFGLFLFVINALMVLLVSALVRGFKVSGFWTALFASVFISILSIIIGGFFVGGTPETTIQMPSSGTWL